MGELDGVDSFNIRVDHASVRQQLQPPSSQDAGPMGVNPMALLGQEGAQKDYYYYYNRSEHRLVLAVSAVKAA
jgi:hypothetical protein